MFYMFPPETFVKVLEDYKRSYENPLRVCKGDHVTPLRDGSKVTDCKGWTWCIAADGRAGWTPDQWCEPDDEGWRLKRDFSALELTVRRDDCLRLYYSESGFLLCETRAGEQGWVPDAIVALEGARFSVVPSGRPDDYVSQPVRGDETPVAAAPCARTDAPREAITSESSPDSARLPDEAILQKRRCDRLKNILQHLESEGITSFQAQATFLGLTPVSLKYLVCEGTMTSTVARELEWAMNLRDGWMDDDQGL